MPERQPQNMTRRRFLQVSAAAIAGGLSYKWWGFSSQKIATYLGYETPSPLAAPEIKKYQRKPLPEIINGINFPSWKNGEYQQPFALQSLQDLSSLMPNLIGIIPTQEQENVFSTEIKPTEKTASDTDLRFIIGKAHDLGYTVMLKPQADLTDDKGHWHGEVGKFFETEKQWQAWLSSYRQMINHYASLAQDTGVELFVVGNENQFATQKWPSDWVDTIHGVRARYDGPITYAAHKWDFESLRWWSEVDLIGVNPYWELTTSTNHPPFTELKSSWQILVSMMEKVSRKWGKPLFFPEIGYPSANFAAARPYDYKSINSPNSYVDLAQQANCIKATYETLINRNLFRGLAWWFWETNPRIGGVKDKNFTPRDKPAADIIAHYNRHRSFPDKTE